MGRKHFENLPDCTPLTACRSAVMEHKRLVGMLGSAARGELDKSLPELEERVRQSEAVLAEAKRAAQATLDALPVDRLRTVSASYYIDGLTIRQTAVFSECGQRTVERYLSLIRDHSQEA